jgi:hypothetical protein
MALGLESDQGLTGFCLLNIQEAFNTLKFGDEKANRLGAWGDSPETGWLLAARLACPRVKTQKPSRFKIATNSSARSGVFNFLDLPL